MKATVIMPTFNNGITLNYSIPSILNQTVKDIELFIIGDGVPDNTRAIIRKFIKKDKRIKFFDNPKDKRHGEIYRHKALKQAKGKIACYLSDDDLMFPDHIETMLKLLKNGNFCHTYLARIEANGEVVPCLIDLSLKDYQHLMLAGVSFIALSFVGHTLSIYRKLPFGWRTAPKGIYRDLYMCQQFLSHPACKPVSGFVPTLFYFPSPSRRKWSIQKRAQELESWSKKLKNLAFIKQYRHEFLEKEIRNNAIVTAKIHMVEELLKKNRVLEKNFARIRSTKAWRLYNLLSRSPIGILLKRVSRQVSF